MIYLILMSNDYCFFLTPTRILIPILGEAYHILINVHFFK